MAEDGPGDGVEHADGSDVDRFTRVQVFDKRCPEGFVKLGQADGESGANVEFAEGALGGFEGVGDALVNFFG